MELHNVHLEAFGRDACARAVVRAVGLPAVALMAPNPSNQLTRLKPANLANYPGSSRPHCPRCLATMVVLAILTYITSHLMFGHDWNLQNFSFLDIICMIFAIF